MMDVVRVVATLAAVVTILATALSAVHTFVLPRPAPVRLSRAVFLTVRQPIVWLGRRRRTPERQEDTLALFAPLSLLLLPVVWLLIIGAGYTVLFWSIERGGWHRALNASGSSMFTLGFVHPRHLPGTFLAFSEAGFGIALLALLITYLPSMYAAFGRREAQVALLEARADRPPWAPAMIIRFTAIGALGKLDEVWSAWEAWFVEVEESHLSLAALPFYRSPIAGRSWVTAAGTVLDGAALVESSLDTPHSFRAQLCIRTGFLALRRIADFFNVAYDDNPRPDDPISITREEFDDALDLMAASGVPIKPDRDQAWRDFSGWRVNYDTVLLVLASITMAPTAKWSADRMPAYRRPPISRRARARAVRKDGR
jgi:hypothetical protein